MKINKKLFVSALALTLTGCDSMVDLPSRYNKIDVQSKSDLEGFKTKLANALDATKEKETEGYVSNFSMKTDEISFEMAEKTISKLYQTALSMDLKNFNIDVKVAENGKKYNDPDYKAAVEFNNLSFDLEINISGLKKYTLSFSDVDIACVYANSNLYLDLSDEDLKNGVDSFCNLIGLASTDAEEVNLIKNSFCGKIYVANVFDYFEEREVESIENISSKVLVDELFEALFELDSNKTLLNSLTFADYENSSAVGIALNFKDLQKNVEKNENDNNEVECTGKMAVYFDESGVFSSFGMECNLEAGIYEEDIRVTCLIDDLKIENECKYGNVKINVPNANDYKPFESFDEILSVLENYIKQ